VDCIIDTSGEPLDEVIENTGWMAFWRSTGGAGLLLARYGIDLLLTLSPAGLPRVAEVGVDFRVLCFTLALSLLA
jgi:hypothetical protein